MGDIGLRLANYCEAKISRLLHVSTLKTDYKRVKLLLNVYKNKKIVMMNNDYQDIGQLLLLMIIGSSKNINVNMQNHPSLLCTSMKIEWLLFCLNVCMEEPTFGSPPIPTAHFTPSHLPTP